MNDAMKEFAGVVKEALVTPVQEAFVYRARNPFFGTLIISWLCYNWNKVAFFFLSDMEVIKRIHYIREKIPDNSVFFGESIPHTHSIFFPILWAILLSLAFPFFTYASILIHKKIFSSIESVNVQREKNRITLQRELVIETALNETARSKQLATDEADIEAQRDRAAAHRINIESIKKEHQALSTIINDMEAQQSSSQLKLEQLSSDIIQASKDLDTLDKKHESFSTLNMRFESLQSETKNIKKELFFTKGRYEDIFVKYEKSQGENINLNEVINKLKKDKVNAESIIKSQKLILARARGFSEVLSDIFPKLFVIGSDGLVENFSQKELSMFKKAYEELIYNKSVVLGEGIGLGLGSVVGNSKGIGLGTAVKYNSGVGLEDGFRSSLGAGLGDRFKSSSGVGVKSNEEKDKKKDG